MAGGALVLRRDGDDQEDETDERDLSVLLLDTIADADQGSVAATGAIILATGGWDGGPLAETSRAVVRLLPRLRTNPESRHPAAAATASAEARPDQELGLTLLRRIRLKT